jgi:thiamine biosynthesis lipoprotein ApbE
VIKAESIESVKGILGELKKFKKKLDFNNLRMVTIKERIGEISQSVERVEAIVEIVKEDSKVLSEDPIENLVLQFNQKSETKLTKVSDALYKVFDKTVTVRINPENEFEA